MYANIKTCMFKGKEYAYGEVLKFMYVSKLCYPTKCCVLCIHSLKLSLKHNEEKTMLFAVWQTLLFHITRIFDNINLESRLKSKHAKSHIPFSELAKNGNIKLTRLDIDIISLLSYNK